MGKKNKTTTRTTISGTVFPGLSDAKKKLDLLREEREREEKNKKMQAVKDLPHDLRLLLAQHMDLKAAIQRIEEIKVEKSKEEVDLETLETKDMARMHTVYFDIPGLTPKIKGLSDDDITNALIEAELLNTDTNDG